MKGKQIIATMSVVMILVIGVVAGVLLVRQNTELRERAAVSGAEGSMRLSPTVESIQVGETKRVNLFFNTGGIKIKAFTFKLSYTYQGNSVPLEIENLTKTGEIANVFETCIPEVNKLSNRVDIEFACYTTQFDGYSTVQDVNFARFDVTAMVVPPQSSIVVSFVPQESYMLTAETDENGESRDILNADTLNSTTFNITEQPGITPTVSPTTAPTFTPTPTSGVTITNTPTPTTAPTNTPTPTATVGAGTPTPTRVPTNTPVPTATTAAGVNTPTPTTIASAPTTTITQQGDTLPDAGWTLPTILAAALGFILLAGAILLAL